MRFLSAYAHETNSFSHIQKLHRIQNPSLYAHTCLLLLNILRLFKNKQWFTHFYNLSDSTFQVKHLGKYDFKHFLYIDGVAGGREDERGFHRFGVFACQLVDLINFFWRKSGVNIELCTYQESLRRLYRKCSKMNILKIKIFKLRCSNHHKHAFQHPNI